MKIPILVSTLCVTLLVFSTLAGAQQNGVPVISLACTPDRCKNWHYDAGTNISMTTDCITHMASTELSFPLRNGSHVEEVKSMNGRRVIDVSDTAVKQTITWEGGGIKNLTTILVSRIDGKYNETREQYSKWGTDRDTISGTCLAASELAKRKF